MLHLASASIDALVDPAMGGCVRALRWHGIDVLRPTPASASTARQASSYPLVPWSNRIGDGALRWQGSERSLARNNAPEPHAIHGTGWQDSWKVVRAAPDEIELLLSHAADDRWPFDFEASQVLRADGDAFDMALSVTNQGSGPMPAGLGWHPFFVKRPGARVQVRAKGRWEMSASKLPTHRIAHQGLDDSTDALDVDHCFDGWDGVAELRHARLTARIISTLRHVVVFTHPDRNVLAIEPVTHVNNVYGDPAIAAQSPRLDLGAIELAPGETLQAAMRIGMAAPKS